MRYSGSRKAFITGVSGYVLTAEEEDFISRERPWGLILFKRNCESGEQIAALVRAFRDLAGHEQAPVFIDQEGGRVQRLRPPLAPDYPPARVLAASRLPDRAVYVANRLIAHDLYQLGINASCAPVLDVAFPQTHDVIGDRAYSVEPAVVARFGRACIDGLLDGSVLPVIKHIPGHGRATCDSHLELPRVSASLDELREKDFPPFTAHRSAPMAMTAHIVYDAIDPDQPITLSKEGIAFTIRDEIGFDGLLMSDDISMKALKGPVGEDSARAIAAGCDIVLHCNGDMAEMADVAAAVPVLQGEACSRADQALAAQVPAVPIDVDALREELRELVAGSTVS